MSRYIDADALAQQVCVKLCTASNCSNVLKIIHDMPTADVVPMDLYNKILEVRIKKQENLVEVVRCKDCTHYKDLLLGQPATAFGCNVHNWFSGEDDYCSFGERREDAEKTD